MTKITEKVSALDAALSELQERVNRSTEKLERKVEETINRIARGTLVPSQPLTLPVVAEDTKPDKRPRPGPGALLARIEEALRAQPASPGEVAKRTSAPFSRVTTALTTLKSAGRIYNLGSEERPIYSWKIGDNTSTAELYSAIEQIIRVRPLEMQEIAAALGCENRNRISGGLVDLQRPVKRLKVRNLGNKARARWFILP